MIIYNVTINIDNDVREEWLSWMKAVHIPEVMATGYFLDYKICKVLIDEEQGTTYSVQYTAANMDDVKEYRDQPFATLTKRNNRALWQQMVAFRTLLEVV